MPLWTIVNDLICDCTHGLRTATVICHVVHGMQLMLEDAINSPLGCCAVIWSLLRLSLGQADVALLLSQANVMRLLHLYEEAHFGAWTDDVRGFMTLQMTQSYPGLILRSGRT